MRGWPGWVPFFPALVLLLLLAGCLQGGPRTVLAEKLGPGHCRHAGVMDVQIVGFNRTRDATLSLSIHNQYDGVLSYDPIILVRTPGDRVTYRALLHDYPGVPYEELSRGEARVQNVTFGQIIDEAWKDFSFTYGYGRTHSRDHYSNFVCSLKGDNTPWAFENGTT